MPPWSQPRAVASYGPSCGPSDSLQVKSQNLDQGTPPVCAWKREAPRFWNVLDKETLDPPSSELLLGIVSNGHRPPSHHRVTLSKRSHQESNLTARQVPSVTETRRIFQTKTLVPRRHGS